MSAGAESLLSHGSLQQAFTIRGELAESTNVAGRHLRVAVYFLAGGSEALELFFTGAYHSLANLCRTFRLVSGAHFLVIHGGDVDVDIDAVHQRAGDF